MPEPAQGHGQSGLIRSTEFERRLCISALGLHCPCCDGGCCLEVCCCGCCCCCCCCCSAAVATLH